MLAKFAVNLLKVSPKLSPASLYSTTNARSPCADGKPKRPPKDWKVEFANRCDRNEILDFVEENFGLKEPLLKAVLRPGQKPKLFREIYASSLDQGLTYVARKCCDDQLVGVMINERYTKTGIEKIGKMLPGIEDCNLLKLMEVAVAITAEPKLHDLLKVDEIFHIAFLAVAESHHGRGMGNELIRTSLEYARKNNFKYANMNCTSDHTRRVAEKLSGVKVWSVPYKELLCRGCIEPRSFPDPPHCAASVFYLDLNNLPKKP